MKISLQVQASSCTKDSTARVREACCASVGGRRPGAHLHNLTSVNLLLRSYAASPHGCMLKRTPRVGWARVGPDVTCTSSQGKMPPQNGAAAGGSKLLHTHWCQLQAVPFWCTCAPSVPVTLPRPLLLSCLQSSHRLPPSGGSPVSLPHHPCTPQQAAWRCRLLAAVHQSTLPRISVKHKNQPAAAASGSAAPSSRRSGGAVHLGCRGTRPRCRVRSRLAAGTQRGVAGVRRQRQAARPRHGGERLRCRGCQRGMCGRWWNQRPAHGQQVGFADACATPPAPRCLHAAPRAVPPVLACPPCGSLAQS